MKIMIYFAYLEVVNYVSDYKLVFRERLKMGRIIGRCVAPSSLLARVTKLSCPLMKGNAMS